MKKQILDLHPTQVCFGLEEVENKVKRMSRMKPKGLQKYLKTRIVPVVIGPGKKLYLIDHHHLARACWEMGHKHIQVKIIADYSKLDLQLFWRRMEARHWVYPYDQSGEKVSVMYHIPDDIRGLADDPFRSLAWMVREKNGFAKVDTPFSEFRWGNFFRNVMTVHPRVEGYDACVKEALKLCKTKAAKTLPGYKE